MHHQNTSLKRNLVLSNIYIELHSSEFIQKHYQKHEQMKIILLKSFFFWILSPAQSVCLSLCIIENIQFPLFENETFDFFPVYFDSIWNSVILIDNVHHKTIHHTKLKFDHLLVFNKINMNTIFFTNERKFWWTVEANLSKRKTINMFMNLHCTILAVFIHYYHLLCIREG